MLPRELAAPGKVWSCSRTRQNPDGTFSFKTRYIEADKLAQLEAVLGREGIADYLLNAERELDRWARGERS